MARIWLVLRNTLLVMLLAVGTTTMLTGCAEDEDAGDQMDQAMEEAGDAMGEAGDEAAESL